LYGRRSFCRPGPRLNLLAPEEDALLVREGRLLGRGVRVGHPVTVVVSAPHRSASLATPGLMSASMDLGDREPLSGGRKAGRGGGVGGGWLSRELDDSSLARLGEVWQCRGLERGIRVANRGSDLSCLGRRGNGFSEVTASADRLGFWSPLGLGREGS